MKKLAKVLLILLLSMCVSFGVQTPVFAAVTDAAPNQEQCDNGSTTYTWDGEGIDRPLITSMTVDGETVADPANPADGSIGVAICPNDENGRKTGLHVVYRDGINYHLDLTSAETPSGDPITANSDISITMADMGDLAEFYTFSLVHGQVSSWEYENLGTADASLEFTFSPARTPLVDFEAEGAAFCTATPPVCDVEQSGMDILNASLDMDFDQTGVCIKTGSDAFNSADPSHSEVITADGSYGFRNHPNDGNIEPCYSVEGIGTDTITVTRLNPLCHGISHIDVIFDNPEEPEEPEEPEQPVGRGGDTPSQPEVQVDAPVAGVEAGAGSVLPVVGFVSSLGALGYGLFRFRKHSL